jgi:hypothetical protein
MTSISPRSLADSQVKFDDTTFKTGLSFPEREDDNLTFASSSVKSRSSEVNVRLPGSINFVALRETVLAEAPFIKRSNKAFWKKWIDSPQFYNILASVQHFIADSFGKYYFSGLYYAFHF